jgi:acetyl-CoA carboxylase carboxyl transferase subunit alpha
VFPRYLKSSSPSLAHFHLFWYLVCMAVTANLEQEQVWQQVKIARHHDRPSAIDYIRRIFDEFVELHGDRHFGDDPAITAGLGFLTGHNGDTRAVTILANQKGHSLKENMRLNYGMANPEGYRKALRLAKQAEKFGRPIVTFVDTSGAYPGIGAEERGIGEAIARNLIDFSRLKAPIICIIIGEGGSGGALGLCAGDRIYMLEHAIFSVISPERGASLLLHDRSRVKDAASMLRLTARDLLSFKMIDGIIAEPAGGAHNDPAAAAARIKQTVLDSIAELCALDPITLVRRRNEKLRGIGAWREEASPCSLPGWGAELSPEADGSGSSANDLFS